ncbi:dTMP kinase [Eubacterium nodatum ATCC 33099]|nr:dTMP kinase [Eubacterium nodatum ATCC 33099]
MKLINDFLFLKFAGINMRKGLFISLEGPDGSGKSTQIEYLKKYFFEKDIPCVFTREPGGTDIGEKIRKFILNVDNSDMCDMTEALLYAASRAQHVAKLIKPALYESKVVICDRFIDSSIAYQAYGRNLGESVRIINEYAVQGCLPDITVFIDIDPEIGKMRIENRANDRLEQEKLLFHKRVYEGYLEMAALEPDRIKTIDGSVTREEMKDEILNQIKPLLKERGFI